MKFDVHLKTWVYGPRSHPSGVDLVYFIVWIKGTFIRNSIVYELHKQYKCAYMYANQIILFALKYGIKNKLDLDA